MNELMDKPYLSKKETTTFKGLLAILVILCHCRSELSFVNNNQILHDVFVGFGYLSVGVFFFISGYGVTESYRNKPKYMQKFLRNRILPLYLKYIVFVIGYAILLYFSGTLRLSLLVQSFCVWGGYTTVINGWYFQIAVLIFLFYWLAFSPRICENHKYIILGVEIAIYILLCIIFKAGWHVYQTVALFWVGTLVSKYKDSTTMAIINKKHIAGLGILGFLVMFVLQKQVCATPFVNTVYMTIMTTVLVISVVSIGFLKLLDYKLFGYIGTISLEIYGIHGAFVTIFRSKLLYIGNDLLFLFLVLSCSILSGIGCHKIFECLDKRIRKT